LPWWWGLWIVTNLLGNVSLIGPILGAFPAAVKRVDAVATATLAFLLIVILRRITRAQQVAIHHDVFA